MSQALCRLFSKHADLAEAATASSSHGVLQSAHAGADSYAHSPSLFAPGCGGSWSQLPWRGPSLGFKRSCRKSRQGEGPSLELDRLPDSLLSYIYSFAPKFVPRDLAVSKRFSICLMKTERVVLDVKCGSEVTEASLMRFERGVELIGKRCWGLADKLTNALTCGWSALVSLDLSDNELDDQSIQRLSIALQQRNTNITSLSLCDNNFTGIGASHIGEALSHFACLRKLNLNGNRIGPVGARHIAAGLEKQQGVMTRLTHLGMGGSAIGAAGVRALVTVLSPASSPAVWKAKGDTQHVEDKGGVLRKLDFSACALGSEGMEALQPLLKWNTSLCELSLSRNELKANGARALAPVMPINLRELNLNFNSLGEEGASALAPALSKMNSLKHLKLFGNLVGHEGAQVLMPVLEGLTSLCSLYLSLNNIDAKNKSKMSGALRHRLRTFHI